MALVHKFKQGEEYIVLDVNSGAVHVVDDIVYDVIPVVGQIFEKKEKHAETASDRSDLSVSAFGSGSTAPFQISGQSGKRAQEAGDH